MEDKNKNRKRVLFIAFILLLLFASVFFLRLNKKSGNKDIITLVSYSFDSSDSESTVFSGLLKYGRENGMEVKYNNNYKYGVFVESIGGTENGDYGKYWQYYVGDVLGEVAADKKILREGDNVEWRFEEVPF